MISLDIYSLHDKKEENVIASLSNGAHEIGRGDLLQVTDKRISRKHALIEVSENVVKLTAIHQNACFFIACDGKCVTIIRQNDSIDLNDGDKFGLLPDDCWFKIKIKKQLEATDNSTKRSLNVESFSDEHTENKKQKTSHCSNMTAKEEEEEETSLNQSTCDLEPKQEESTLNGDPGTSTSHNNEHLPTVKIEKEEISDIYDALQVKIEETNESDDVVAGPSSENQNDANGTNVQREKCWYGAGCYRKNPSHRAEFSHPGDADYSDDDTRPDCPFGAACYRRNPDHRRHFKHLGLPVHKPSKVYYGGCPFCVHCRNGGPSGLK